jgi:very-short-patch-repair endonuclease
VDFLGLCRKAGLPVPAVNVLVAGCLVDFFWPGQRVVVEVDSYRYHGDRSAFERDHGSTLALENEGYKVHRITERMLFQDPGPFLDLVGRSLRGNSTR